MNFADRVKDTTTTTGTGTLTLANSPPTGFRSFAAAYATNTDRIPYCIQDAGGSWEVGSGTLLTGTTLRRDLVMASSNAGSLVNFGAGSKDVFVTIPGRFVTDLLSRGRIEMARLGMFFA